MKIKIKRFDKSLPRPEYKTSGAVAFDLYNRNKETFSPNQIKIFPTNVGIKVPRGHFLMINSRSSTAIKTGLLIINGVVDQDFCGDEDELHIQGMNLTKRKLVLPKGTRVAQGILVKISKASFTEVKKLSPKSRGGFGTTGF
jgi:dUTP pyrophosphatase